MANNNSYRKQINMIKADVGRIANNLSKGLAEQAKKDLVKSHDQILDNYYKAHNPSSYNRKHNLYNSIMNHTIKKKNKSAGGRSYTASVIIGGAGMNEVYRISADNVFDLVWNKGVRGLPKQGKNPITKDWINPITQIHYSYNNERWQNPYWSGTNDPYHNIFMTSIVIGNYISKVGIPNNVMKDVVDHWWQANGKTTCEKIINNIKK